MSEKLNQFSVEVYGNLEPYNEVISKARVRIFISEKIVMPHI